MSIILKEYPDNLDEKFIKIFSSWWKDQDIFSLLQDPIYERYYILWQYSKELSSLKGDFVECGSFIGTSAIFMAEECKTTLHLVDSWEGLSKSGEYDNPIYFSNDNKFIHKFKENITTIKNNLKNYDNIQYHKGWIPEVLKINKPISLLHLDLDLYQPTKDSLEYFWDKMIDGGVIISDFHDEVATGAAKATRDFFKDLRNIEVLPTGKAIIIK